MLNSEDGKIKKVLGLEVSTLENSTNTRENVDDAIRRDAIPPRRRAKKKRTVKLVGNYGGDDGTGELVLILALGVLLGIAISLAVFYINEEISDCGDESLKFRGEKNLTVQSECAILPSGGV